MIITNKPSTSIWTRADGYQRYYSLENAAFPDPLRWMGIDGFTNILGEGQTVIYSNWPESSVTGAVFFRGRVRLEEE